MIRVLALLAFATTAFSQTPTVTAVVNSNNYPGQLTPGIVAVVFGTNFGSVGSNVSVAVGGKPAYVFVNTVTPTSVAVEIPTEIGPGATSLVVAVGGAASAPYNITLVAYAPTLLTQNGSGAGAGLIYTTATNKLVTLTAPAHPGDSLFLYATGLGPTNPPTPTGAATAANPTAIPVTLTIGGVTAKVAFAGAASGTAGAYQINFTVPANLQGTQPLVISVGGLSTLSNVTIPLAGLSSIVNSASFANPGTASPGAIVTAFANSLGTTTDQFSGVFPSTRVSGVQITFNGIAAPEFAVYASGDQQQVNLLVPTELPTSGMVNVQLVTPTGLYANYPLQMVPANPGLFHIPDPKIPSRLNVIAQFAGTAGLALPVSTTAALGLPACTKNLSPATTCGQPATIGDNLVIYATGLGLATPNGDPNGKPLPTGSVAPADGSVLYKTPTTPVVTIAGVPALVQFCGIVPGISGEFQINVQVPSGVTSGDDVPVMLSILGASDTATISIQPRGN